MLKPRSSSAEEALREFRRIAKLLPHRIRADDLLPQHKRLYKALLHHFGSVARAREAAGLPAPEQRRLWSTARVVAELRKLHESGRRVTRAEVERHGPAGLQMAVLNYAGGIRRARQLARVPEPRRRYRARYNWDPAIVVREISRRHRSGDSIAVSKTPRSLVATACKLFGSWGAAVEAAGIDYQTIRLRPRYSDDELLGLLRAFAATHPDATITETLAQPWCQSVVRHFGSIPAAARAAKLSRWPRRRLATVYDRKETVRRLRARHARGKPIYQAAVERDDPRLPVAVERHFGTWVAMLAALRLPNDSPRKMLMLGRRA